MLNHLKKHKYAYSLAVLAIFAYHSWISFGIFSVGDWTYMAAHTAKDYLRLSIWDSLNGFGSPDSYSWRLPLNIGYGLFGFLGFDKNVSEKFLVFWPTIIVGLASAYLLLKHYFDKRAAFVGALVANFNTYYLASSTHILLYTAGAYAIAATYAYMLALEKKQLRYYILTALLMFVSGFYDIRLLYFTIFTVATFALFKNTFYEPKWRLFKVKGELLSHVFMVGTLMGLFTFWFVGILTAGALGGDSILGRSLFGNQYWSVSAALALFHPFWTGGFIYWFQSHPVIFYFWILPIFAFCGMVLDKSRKLILYFAFLALFGILLAKQVDHPFSGLYPWLYANLPGFNAFREATKFYYFIILGYAFLIAAFFNYLGARQNKSMKMRLVSTGAFTAIVLVFVVSLIPLATNKINTMFQEKKIPGDYQRLYSFLEKDKEPYRTLWVPRSTQWTYFSAQNPKVSAIDFASGFHLIDAHRDNTQTREQVIAMINANNHAVLRTNIKYVVVPLRDEPNDDDAFIDYGDDRTYFIDSLEHLPTLKRIDAGTKDTIVFKNELYKPEVAAVPNIFRVGKTADIDNIAAFSSKGLGVSKSDITFSNVPSSITANINDLYPADKALTLSSDGKVTIPKSEISGKLFVDKSRSNTIYSIANNSLSIRRDYLKGLVVGNSSPYQPRAAETKILSLNPNQRYVLAQGDSLYSLSFQDSRQRKLGSSDDEAILYTTSGLNQIKNGSFENSVERDKSSDCDPSAEGGILLVQQNSTEHTNGRKSISLQSRKHLTCFVTEPFNVQPGTSNDFSFDYKATDSKQSGFKIVFNDTSRTTIRMNLSTTEHWKTYRQKVTVPKGASSAQLYLESYTPNLVNEHPVNYYDNIQFTLLNPVDLLLPATKPTYESFNVAKDQSIEYKDNRFAFSNLIVNGSFERGLWQDTVGDCNNYDSHPNLKMSLDTKSQTDGKNSLLLQSIRHTACTSAKQVKVSENGTYRLSFDYRSSTKNGAGYYISFNDPQQTTINDRLDSKGDTWNSFNKQIVAPFGATQMQITVYSYPDDYKKASSTVYDNFKLTEVPDLSGAFFTVSTPSIQTAEPKSISLAANSPTNKVFTIEGTEKPFVLSLNESYASGWKIVQSDKKALSGIGENFNPNSITNHFKLNDTLNGWIVYPRQLCHGIPSVCTKNADGTYNIRLAAHYTPQQQYEKGLLFSGAVLMATIVYLASAFIKKPSREKILKPKAPKIYRIKR